MNQYKGVKVKIDGQDCYVVHADRVKGITIHYMDSDEPAWCLNREQFLATGRRMANRFYHEIFTWAIKGIERGKVERYCVRFGHEVLELGDHFIPVVENRSLCAFK